MGLFSGSTKVYTTAQVYNLAGDEKDHVDGLKSAILGSILQGNNDLGGTIANTIQSGHASRLRRYYRFMRDNAPERALQARLSHDKSLDPESVVGEIKTLLGLGTNDSIDLRKVEVDVGILDYFAEAWIIENHPSTPEEDWSVDLDAIAGEMVITVIENEVPMEYRLPLPDDFLWATENGERLLYANFVVLSADPVTQEIVETRPQLFVYRVGSGNVVLDGAVEDLGPQDTEFYPVLTLRRNNKSIRDKDAWADQYDVAKKAYRRLTGQSLDDLIDGIEENEGIDDIDFCHLIQGVSMNTQNQAGLEYLYRFWEKALAIQAGTKEDIILNLPSLSEREGDAQARRTLTGWDRGYGPGSEDAMPETVGRPQRRQAETTLHFLADDLEDQEDGGSSGGLIGIPKQFYYTINWRYVEETIHVGNAKHHDGDTSREALKVGEFWMEQGPNIMVWGRAQPQNFLAGGDRPGWTTKSAPTVYFYHQHARNRYTRLEICDARHKNFIYKAHSEVTEAHKKLGSDEVSPFIVPFSSSIAGDMGMRKINNLQGSCSYLVFNAYERVHVPWWQSGFFKILITIAVIAVSFYIAGPAGLINGSGILGANVAVGISLGMSTVLSAAIAGAIANSIAAMIVTRIVMWGSTKLFGEKWGRIIGVIASFFAMNMAANYFGNGSLSVDWGRMLRVENLMNLSNSVTDVAVALLDADTQEILAQMEEEASEYDADMEEIQERYEELLGVTDGLIDPMMLTDAALGFVEPADTFLSRTLLTGSDIAGITQSMITDFTDITLRLPDAID